MNVFDAGVLFAFHQILRKTGNPLFSPLLNSQTLAKSQPAKMKAVSFAFRLEVSLG